MIPAARRVRRIAITVALALGPVATPAQAQFEDFGPNCERIQIDDMEKFRRDICATHVGCLLVRKIKDSTCRTKEFLDNLGDHLSPSRPLSSEDVMDAMPSDAPTENSIFQRAINRAKDAARSVLGTDDGKLVENTSGSFTFTEVRATPDGGYSGTIIYPNGGAQRGKMNSQYRLDGPGQQMLANGKVLAGTFNGSRLEGFVTDATSGRGSFLEGTFDGDKPVGEMIRNYADGSRVRELWERGAMVLRGTVAPKGYVPPPLVRPAPPTQQPDTRLAQGSMSSSQSGSAAAAATVFPAVSVWRGERGSRFQFTARAGGYEIRVFEREGLSSRVQFIAGGVGTYRYHMQYGEQIFQFLDPNTIRLTGIGPGLTSDVLHREQ